MTLQCLKSVLLVKLLCLPVMCVSSVQFVSCVTSKPFTAFSVLACYSCFEWYLMEVSLQNMAYLIAVFSCCKGSFSSSLATKESSPENKTSFQSWLLLHISDLLSVPVTAVNFLS